MLLKSEYLIKLMVVLLWATIFLILPSCASYPPEAMAIEQKLYLKYRKPDQWERLKKQNKLQKQKQKLYESNLIY